MEIPKYPDPSIFVSTKDSEYVTKEELLEYMQAVSGDIETLSLQVIRVKQTLKDLQAAVHK